MASKSIKQGKIEIDYEDYALLVNYELEVPQIDRDGNVIYVDRKQEVRRIKLKPLTIDKNIPQLASDIVDKCKYIHPSRTEEVEKLLIKLRKYSIGNDHSQYQEEMISTDRNNRDGNYKKSDRNQLSDNNNNNNNNRNNVIETLPPASINDIDDYLDMLYTVSGKSDKDKEQSLKLQERGAAMFLKLCRDVMNLEQLIQNSTIMGALTRVLQEEYKKSVELTFNILRIFLAFSNFMEMHSLMASYRIGILTMKAIDFEMKRVEVRESERLAREYDFNTELENAKSDLINYPIVLERIKKQRKAEDIKYAIMNRKQDKLLFVGFYILLNLAEDLNVEKKMVKKQLIQTLSLILDRSFEDLLILCVTFLKKLSLVAENIDAMKECSILQNLIKFISSSSNPLVTISLRLLFNLSFDKELRDQMLRGGIIPKLVSLLKTPTFRAKTLKLLYHLSVDDRCKSMINYTDGIPILMGLVINFPQDLLARELAALMINLSYNSRNVEQMISNKGLNLLIDRVADKRDPLLLKIIRNISLWTFKQQEELEAPEVQYKYRGLWSPHIKVLMEIMKEEDNHDIQIEVFGCLANMTIYDLPASSNWKKLLREYNLINMFCKMLVPGLAQNDLILEIVMLISTIASDLDACNMIASSSLIGLLYQLWEEKSNDTELLLQLIHCFHKLFMFDSSREEAMYSTRIVVDIIECLGHKSEAVQQKAAQMCEIVLEFDRDKSGEIGNLGRKILQKKFESYNKVWLANVMEDYESNTLGSSYPKNLALAGSNNKGRDYGDHQSVDNSEWKTDQRGTKSVSHEYDFKGSEDDYWP